MANGSPSWLEGLPSWAKVTGVLGFPVVMASWLLYLVTVSMPAMAQTHAVLSAEISSLHDRLRAHEDLTASRMVPLLDKICRRLGKNDFERESCQ